MWAVDSWRCLWRERVKRMRVPICEHASSQRSLCIKIYMHNPLVSSLTYCICPQLSQMCPFPESFLRAISCAEEFSPLPNASSTTGGPIILNPYRDGDGEVWGGGGYRGISKATHYLYILLLFKMESSDSTSTVVLVTESRSQKYLQTNFSFP